MRLAPPVFASPYFTSKFQRGEIWNSTLASLVFSPASGRALKRRVYPT